MNAIALNYNGVSIRHREEMLSLTDMWKATGSDFVQQPSNWIASAEAGRFIEALALLNPGISGIIETKKGKGGGTWAHWQVGLAYAKYLSPEFHMWCNEVVRERMEERRVAPQLPSAIVEQIERGFGIQRMLAHKITEMEKVLALIASRPDQPHIPVLIRHGKTAGQILRAAGFPPLKGLASWFGNRLAAFGCRIENNGCAEMGISKARLFDPDKASHYLENGGKVAVEGKIAERRGQGRLRLVVQKD